VTEENKNQEQDQPTATDAWNEVGQQIQMLGASLASAFNASVQDEEVQQQLKTLQSELDTAAAQINQKAKEVSESVKSVNVEEETKKLDDETQAAGQDLVKEVQPHLLNALKKMQTGLDQIVNNLEKEDTEAPATEDAADEALKAL
jgi:hypothetical protein